MCGSVQRQDTQPLSWQDAGQVTSSWREYKVTIGIGATFAVVAVAGVVWGGIDLFSAYSTKDATVFKEGVIALGAAAASGIVSTIAFTRLCIVTAEDTIPQHEAIV